MMALPQNDQKVQDAVKNSWVDTKAPMALRPYLRLSRFDRPVGAWLLFLPCLFGACFAAVHFGAQPADFAHFVLVCFLGSCLMRGAGCTWNDIVDRHIDAQVARTRSRPIPSGAVSVYGAAIWMCTQAVIALMALVTLEPRSIYTAIASLAVVALYPFAKRFTNWPQIVLGLAFNWGVILAYIELGGEMTTGALALYLAMIFWTLYYDTIYAYQDIRDDENVGVKSTARVLKHHPKRYLTSFALISFLLIIIAIVSDILPSNVFIAFGFGFGALLLLGGWMKQMSSFASEDPERCLVQFRDNVKIGQIVAGVWILCALIAYWF